MMSTDDPTSDAASALTVREEPTPPPDWDDFVTAQPGGTFCHLAAWREIMEDVLGHEAFHVTARRPRGELEGVLPLVRVRSRLFGHYLVSMPFLNYGGPVGSARALRALSRWALDRARSDRVDLLELRWRRAALGIAESADPEEAPGVTNGLSITARKVAVLLPLPATADSLWEDSLRSKVRSQIRRPLKEGFEARFGAEQIDPFYEVFARNMRDLGTPVLPKRLFESLPRLFGESVAVAVVYDDRTPIAAGCGFFHGGEFEITWASSLREYSRAAPNMLLYWRMLEAAIDRGATTFNFGRCTRGSGTHRFKLQWGGHDELMPWAAWSPDGRSATPNPDQTKYRLATSAWARLPVGVTRLLGPPLARRIP